MIGWLKNLLGASRVARLSPEEAHQKAKAGAIILDVRTPLERKEEKIPGSLSLPLDRLPTEWAQLPKDKEIICQCRSGARSAQAARFLAEKGYRVYNLAGGLEAWKRAKLPVK
ncbi:MAG: rhodanese-like domain-containing protein [Meiothermus sp.]|uniref:rhodanese-like domain-containing protein n=1 Tax=Meiothermus sp. TaxID=1955249 RepID=UPI002634C7DA|nr:rhodanese-like domain-containing protein [Meiothermus sp.]MCS7058119.1 rhodanese-like domain-containing protein [Meiothermus sp.]MCX7740268.1 rhodanese-like domain-containing protein [Meiothermus sp.]MDW8089839.1 rhodanese-like domain-containing protein [Meiothermus sp.]MDW8481734.1 rhodanese-like domain-containing protein [Meiothermus sp.]